ncbi:glutamine-hydrolyzing carbamoyl-phosphate synthase small subunit [Candidatus Pyrohabitans sp.]
MKAALVLEDGTIVSGEGFGAEGEVYGEVVFCTSMTGYQEALTDPSYAGQILLLTYPLVGNYGVNSYDSESLRIQVEGFVVREACGKPSHRSAEATVDEFLKREGIPGIAGVDTRALTIKIRSYGVMKGALKTSQREIDAEALLERCRAAPDIGELDLVSGVTCEDIQHHPGKGPRIAILDLGMKWSIRDNFLKRGCEVYVLPAKTSPKEILNLEPHGVVVSPGPGDPKRVPYAIRTVRELMGEVPLFGICLGHQMLALASGGETYKLKFGHRGANQPVKDLRTGRVYITSQNHGYAVDAGSLPEDEFRVDKLNLNDSTVEGMRHRSLEIMSVQYHPEANPGPKDSEYLFDEFLEMIRAPSPPL